MKYMGAMPCRPELTTTFNPQGFGISADPGMIGDQFIRLDTEMVQK